jgi:hypothetical protein
MDYDEHLVEEMGLLIQNDESIYRRRIEPFEKNFARKIRKGIYSKDLAFPAIKKYVVKQEGVPLYQRVHGVKPVLSETELNAVTSDVLERIEDNARVMVSEEMNARKVTVKPVHVKKSVTGTRAYKRRKPRRRT